jgi:anti-sigma B factor antagonist
MEVSVTKEGDIWVLCPKGELDAASSILFDEAIEKAKAQGAEKILIDFEELNYISSAGLGVILSHLDEFEEKHIKLAICSMKPKVANVFEILGVDRLLNIYGNRSEANTYLNEA